MKKMKIVLFSVIVLLFAFFITWSIFLENFVLFERSNNIVEIINSMPENEGLFYSKESVLSINGKTFNINSKMYYDENGQATKMIVFGSEGGIEYLNKDLIEDKSLFDHYGFKKYVNINLENIELLKLNNEYYLEKSNEKRIRIYRVKVSD